MKTWTQYVTEAKQLVSDIKTNKLKIARLAILATELPDADMSVGRFAREIGMDANSLTKWIAAYKEYRKKHPVKEPEPKDYKPAAKTASGKPASDNVAAPVSRTTIHISIKTKTFLAEVNRMKDRIKDNKVELKHIDDKVRKELIVKLREIAFLLEKQ